MLFFHKDIKQRTAALVKQTKISTYQEFPCKTTEQISFGRGSGTGLRQLLGLWEPRSQNHALPTSSTIVLMQVIQGVSLTRLQVITTKWMCSFRTLIIHSMKSTPDSSKATKVWYSQTGCRQQWTLTPVIKMKCWNSTRSSLPLNIQPVSQ